MAGRGCSVKIECGTNLLHLCRGRSKEFDVSRADSFLVPFQSDFRVAVVFKHDEGVSSGAAVSHTNEQNAIFAVQNLRRRIPLAEELVLHSFKVEGERTEEKKTKGRERNRRGKQERSKRPNENKKRKKKDMEKHGKVRTSQE